MKRELQILAAVLYWAFVLGYAAPQLVSTSHSELVIAGFALVITSGYLTYRWLTRLAGKPTRKSKRTKK